MYMYKAPWTSQQDGSRRYISIHIIRIVIIIFFLLLFWRYENANQLTKISFKSHKLKSTAQCRYWYMVLRTHVLVKCWYKVVIIIFSNIMKDTPEISTLFKQRSWRCHVIMLKPNSSFGKLSSIIIYDLLL